MKGEKKIHWVSRTHDMMVTLSHGAQHEGNTLLPKVVDGDNVIPIVILACCSCVSSLLKGRETQRGGGKRKVVGNESVQIQT